MDKPRISILGCGWLGFPLAQRLVKLHYSIKGSSTHPEKIPQLQNSQIDAFCIECLPNDCRGENVAEFFNSEILFLNIPFRRNLIDPIIYQKQIEEVVAQVNLSPIEWLIFTSSTSVYPNQLSLAKEDVSFVPDNRRSEVLLAIEYYLRAQKKFRTTILRLAGLYGGSRQIGGFLSGKKASDPQSPTNLIHLDDCVAIIEQIIARNLKDEVFNLCSDIHPTKYELYTKAAQKLRLPLPDFEVPLKQSLKIVDNSKIKSALNYQFIHPNPLLSI